VKNLKFSIIILFLVCSILTNSSFAQNGDDDGDGVKNLDDFCPATKGMAENKGCPEKPLVAGKAANSEAQKRTPGCISGDCVNGIGKINITDGDYYEGGFVNQKRQGQGTYIWANGKKYVGNFYNGLMQGFGIFYYENGDVYEGSFFQGLRHGDGTFSFNSSGFVYIGKFLNGNRHGIGITYDKDKNIFQQGYYADNKFVLAMAPKPRDPAEGYDPSAEVVLPPGIQVRRDYANPNNEGRELYEAIEKADDTKALELIKNGINLNYQHPEGDSTLSAAIRSRNTRMAKILLLAGVNPNFISPGGGSPLSLAVQMSNKEIVELLINKYKVKVPYQTTGYSILHIAADFNATADIVKILLAGGANPNVYDEKKQSPLSVLQAKNNPNEEMLALLMAASNAQIKEAYYKQKAANEAAYAKNEKEADNIKLDVNIGNKKAALREYDRVHPQIERYMKRYAELLTKYRKAGEAQFLYKGTAADIIDTKGKALETIREFLKKHGEFLPKDLKEHLQSDAAKFVDAPNY